MAQHKPVVIGLYGLPGSGKTYWKRRLENILPGDGFCFFEGSDVIAGQVPNGGLEAFKTMGAAEKEEVRLRAINDIKRHCEQEELVGVVAGHLMFWNAKDEAPTVVWNKNDATTYTHIIYLDVPVTDIYDYRQGDNDSNKRMRDAVSISRIEQWKAVEKAELRKLCRDSGILFVAVNPTDENVLVSFLHDFREHNPTTNLSRAKTKLEDFFKDKSHAIQTALILDGDKTLCESDAGTELYRRLQSKDSDHALLPNDIFASHLQYSYTAFRQAALLLEELCQENSAHTQVIKSVAWETKLHPEFIELLQAAGKNDHVAAVVITCGPRALWECILEANGLSDFVRVIGGGRIDDGFVVTADVKAALVQHLKANYQAFTCAFGDSTLDLAMLKQADRAIVVAGPMDQRSKSMERALFVALHDGLRARQALLPPSPENCPRLDTAVLPIVDITSPEFHNELLERPARRSQVLFAPRKVAQLLMTPTRDASLSGPLLREAHRRVGWYLATEFLPGILGLETYDIPHVQGNTTEGFRVCDEETTLIVPLMRGGEPMAFGVSDVLPKAGFVHAKEPDHLTEKVLRGRRAVILVDSVINTGMSIVPFVQRVRELGQVCVIVIAGVVQSGALESGDFASMLGPRGNVSLVALRISANKFIGRGGTDTGHRLFSTTWQDAV